MENRSGNPLLTLYYNQILVYIFIIIIFFIPFY